MPGLNDGIMAFVSVIPAMVLQNLDNFPWCISFETECIMLDPHSNPVVMICPF